MSASWELEGEDWLRLRSVAFVISGRTMYSAVGLAYRALPLESKFPGEIELEQQRYSASQPLYGYLSTVNDGAPPYPPIPPSALHVSSKLPRETFTRHLVAFLLFFNGLFLFALTIFITTRTTHFNGQWLIYGVTSRNIQIGTLTAFTGLYISAMRIVFDFAFVQILMAQRGRSIKRTVGVRLRDLLVHMTNTPFGIRGTLRVWVVRLSLAGWVILAGFLSRQGLVSVRGNLT
ncbi:hypothetical protein T439DRAFT_369850 [Meredithblackwellia eburnea MCA 4105]